MELALCFSSNKLIQVAYLFIRLAFGLTSAALITFISKFAVEEESFLQGVYLFSLEFIRELVWVSRLTGT